MRIDLESLDEFDGHLGATGSLAGVVVQSIDRDMSAATADLADAAVRSFVEAGLQSALVLLNQRRNDLDALAQRLMEEETLDEDQITDLLGAPPVPSEVAAMERTTLD